MLSTHLIYFNLHNNKLVENKIKIKKNVLSTGSIAIVQTKESLYGLTVNSKRKVASMRQISVSIGSLIVIIY